MTEYIIEWSGIGARIVELIGSVPTCLIPKRLREERLREEIVRCRDCVHAEPEKEPPRKGCEGLLWCDYLTEGIGFSVLPYNFCAWGERKEGGE